MNRSDINKRNAEIGSFYEIMNREMTMSQTDETTETGDTQGYYYIKLNEISKRWIADETPIWSLMSSFFVGLYSVGIPYSFILKGDGKRISLFVGTVVEKLEVLSKMLAGVFPQLRFEKTENGDRLFAYREIDDGRSCVYGGFLKGDPTGNKNYQNVYQIDSVIKGMSQRSWILSLFAIPVHNDDMLAKQQDWTRLESQYSMLTEVSFTESENNLETVSYKQQYPHSEMLIKKALAFCERLTEGIASGEWCTTINFSSDSEENACLLGGLLTSAFYGDESEPEPVHAIYSMRMIREPLVNGFRFLHDNYCGIQYPRYSTMLSSKALAVYAALPTIDTFGFSVIDYVEFDVNRSERGDLVIGRIIDSGVETESTYRIDANEFNRHCLVVGLTGSGKTNTLKSLICELTKGSSRPLMVIEPAKKEYWELYKLGYSDLQIYSVGSVGPHSHRFCINPFERAAFKDENGNVRTVPIQTHIDFVYAAFKASFIMYTPMPYVLERAIYKIYEDYGWDIHNDRNANGKDVYPTIEDLYYAIPEIVDEMGYDTRMRNDLIGSLQARVNSMRLGTKGDTLNVLRSFPMDRLLNGSVVIELEDIGDDDVKAFIISLLLVNLLEYRRQQEDCQLEVRHLMLIEEAHRLLKNVQSGSGENADPRGAAVEFFCNLLAELRSKGQGFIIADQIPSKLAPDLIKNTNLKIVHRTVAAEERMLIGGAMHMTDEQIDSLASLRQGVAAVYSEGDNRPKLVKPKFAGSYEEPGKHRITRERVLFETAKNCISTEGNKDYESLTDKRSKLCMACDRLCRKDPEEILWTKGGADDFRRFARSLDPAVTKSCVVKTIDTGMERFVDAQMGLSDPVEIQHAKNCMLNCLIRTWDLKNTDPELCEKLVRVYIKERINKRK
ncbi:MAG: ATP-binding protein [Clostridia bacterium]|nr:ATP-binding protein [Clostridia bacterium]